jgi:hypothetical protein
MQSLARPGKMVDQLAFIDLTTSSTTLLSLSADFLLLMFNKGRPTIAGGLQPLPLCAVSQA